MRGIFCDCCDMWTHASCCDVDINEYERLGVSEGEWFCPSCVAKELPFADVTINSYTDLHSSFASSEHHVIFGGEQFDDGLIVSHINVRSLISKLDEIQALLSGQRKLVVGISETWLDESVSSAKVFHQLSLNSLVIVCTEGTEMEGAVVCWCTYLIM